jgi:hypothetical protein
VLQVRHRVRGTPALAGALAELVLGATSAARGRRAAGGPRGGAGGGRPAAGPCAAAEKQLLQAQQRAALERSVRSRWGRVGRAGPCLASVPGHCCPTTHTGLRAAADCPEKQGCSSTCALPRPRRPLRGDESALLHRFYDQLCAIAEAQRLADPLALAVVHKVRRCAVACTLLAALKLLATLAPACPCSLQPLLSVGNPSQHNTVYGCCLGPAPVSCSRLLTSCTPPPLAHLSRLPPTCR